MSIFSGPYFPALRPNIGIYAVYLLLQSEYGKKRTRKTPNTDTFYAVKHVDFDISRGAFIPLSNIYEVAELRK